MLLNYKEFFPQIDETTFVAKNAQVIGKVETKEDSSIWFGAVIRADVNTITIGERSNIQDNAVVHCDDGHPTVIGNDVTVGHGAIIHGAMVGDNTLIGMGSIVLDGARIGKNCIIGAGALVPQGKEIPDNSLVVGSPGKILRSVAEVEIAGLKDSALRYVILETALGGSKF